MLKFKHVFFRSFVGSNGASQVVFAFLLIPCCLATDFRAAPFLPNISFLWGWNAPTEPCSKKFSVSIDLSLFSLIGNPQKDAIGQPITLFYVDRLGLYPHLNKHNQPEHGGLPQLGNLTAHLAKARTDINTYIPKDDPGLAIIDWEEWRPIWARNWKPKDIYRNKSIQWVQRQNPQLSAIDASNTAKQNFETAGKNFMKETLTLAKSIRPKNLWGYYLFPDCYNHHYTGPVYNGSCPYIEMRRNNELGWLWNESTALYPSIYLNTVLKDSIRGARFVRNRVLEAIRVSGVRNAKSPLPIFVYARPVFTDVSSEYLTKDTCRKLQGYMNTTLNPYIINVTLAAKMCSQVFCQEKGVCTRKDVNTESYLHLNPIHLTVELVENGQFTIKGEPTVEDLKLFADHFICSCFANMACEKKVNVETDTIYINVCASKNVCLRTVLNPRNATSPNSTREIFHSTWLASPLAPEEEIVFPKKLNGSILPGVDIPARLWYNLPAFGKTLLLELEQDLGMQVKGLPVQYLGQVPELLDEAEPGIYLTGTINGDPESVASLH
ncbi:hyaluronidase PH-20 [Molossus nigricans]